MNPRRRTMFSVFFSGAVFRNANKITSDRSFALDISQCISIFIFTLYLLVI